MWNYWSYCKQMRVEICTMGFYVRLLKINEAYSTTKAQYSSIVLCNVLVIVEHSCERRVCVFFDVCLVNCLGSALGEFNENIREILRNASWVVECSCTKLHLN